MKENYEQSTLPHKGSYLESHPLGVISCIPYSMFWLRSVTSDARCTKSQKRSCWFLFSPWILLETIFYFFRVLIKEHSKEFFFTFFFSTYVYPSQAGYFRKPENLMGEQKPTNLGNPSGQSSLSGYLAWFSSSVFVLTLGCAFQQRWEPLGESLWGTRCVPSPGARGREEKGKCSCHFQIFLPAMLSVSQVHGWLIQPPKAPPGPNLNVFVKMQ